MHILCSLAQPITLATELYSKGMISQLTKDKAIQLTGMVNYEKNVHVLNEVEKAIKYDSSQLAVFCSILQNIPNMKQYGDQILQEAGLPNTTQCLMPAHVPSVIESISIQDDRHQSVYIDYDIAIDIMCLESKYINLLYNTKAALQKNAIPFLQLQCFIKAHIGGTSTIYDMNPTLDGLFHTLIATTSFLDYGIVTALIQTYLQNFDVKNDCTMYIQEVKTFCSSTTLGELKKDCEKKMALLPHTEKILLKVDDRWNDVTIERFKRLLKVIFRSMFTRMEVKHGSLVITGTVLAQKMIDIVTPWDIAFIKAIGVLLLKVGDTVIYEVPEQEHTSITLEEGLSAALQSGNVSAVALLLAVSIDTHPLSHTLISKTVAIRDSNGYTVLHRACQWGHDDIVELLLKTGQCDVEAMAGGWTPLMLAINNNHPLIVKLLSGWSYELYKACANGQVQKVSFLLKHGIDPSVPIHAAVGWTPLMIASYKGHKAVVSALLNSKHDIINTQADTGATALYVACQEGHHEIASALLNANANPNIATKIGSTPLMMASDSNKEECVYVVLKVRSSVHVDIDATNNKGETALTMACRKGHNGIVRILLKEGADTSKETTTGDTAISIAVGNDNREIVKLLYTHQYRLNYRIVMPPTLATILPFYHRKHNPALSKGKTTSLAIRLIIASYNGHNNVVNSLVSDGVDVNAHNNAKRTALHYACTNGHNDVVTTLLQSNADPTIQDNNGYTPLMMASAMNHNESVCTILDSKHYQNSLATYMNIQNNNGETALHLACKQGNSKITSALLNANANPDQENKNGWTPLLFTSGKGYTKIVQLLLEHGADIDHRSTVIGTTALILASEHGHTEIVRILLEKGADVRIESANGDTAISVAAKRNFKEIVELLYFHRQKLARSVSQLSISSFTGSFSDDASLLSKATLSSDTAFSDNNSYKVMPTNLEDQTSLVTQITVDSGIADDESRSDTTTRKMIESEVQERTQITESNKDNISVATGTSIDSGIDTSI